MRQIFARMRDTTNVDMRREAGMHDERPLHVDREPVFAEIFEHASEGMLVMRGDGRVMQWNAAIAHITGYPAREVVGSQISLLSPALATIPEQPSGLGLQATMMTARGMPKQVRATFSALPTANDSLWVVAVRDVASERESERIHDDYVATVSHEMRTPLTAIKGFLETMRREDVSLVPEQVAMFLDIMSEQADRLERLVTDLLDVSAIESGRPLRVHVQEVDLAAEVRRGVQAFESAHPECEIELMDPRASLLARTDPHRLQQIVANLLENARKHAAASPIEVSFAQRAAVLELLVSDRGPGIGADDVRHIFDRFYSTTDSVTRSSGGGAGLGLYICRRLLEAMDGGIEVRSEIGSGSTFVVSLPAVVAARCEQPAASSRREQAG